MCVCVGVCVWVGVCGCFDPLNLSLQPTMNVVARVNLEPKSMALSARLTPSTDTN